MLPTASQFLRGEGFFVLAVLVGVALRLHQLGTQIIASDEWHALYALRGHSFKDILVRFGEADSCIPLTLFYKVASLTVGLTEWIMRLPILLAGVASLVVFPLLVRRAHGRGVATLFAWLLAISPLHIYFSRYARPYSIALLLTFVAVMAFHLHGTTSRPWAKWLYLTCAALAPYFHLSALPLVLLPLLLALLARRLHRTEGTGRHSPRELFMLIGVLAGVWMLLLGPPLLWDWKALHSKLALPETPKLTSYVGGLQLLLGVGALSPAALALALLGGLAWARRDSRLGLWGMIFVVAPFMVVLALRPVGSSYPIVVARYALVSLPFLLWAVAAGIVELQTRLAARARWLSPSLAATWIVVSVFCGPLPREIRVPNNWTNHGVFHYFPTMAPEGNPYAAMLRPREISPFYAQLGRLPPASLRLVEAPWYYEWKFNPFPFYQDVHRQETLIGFVDDRTNPTRPGELPLHDGRFAFRRFVHVLDEKALCDRRVDLIVLHKNLPHEFKPLVPLQSPAMVPAIIASTRASNGPPIYEDAILIVFDMRPRCGPGQFQP